MPPSQKGWPSNIKAMKGLWNTLKNTPGFNYFKTRAINQDSIENIGIRSYCGDNANPTTVQFITSFKTHIVNGMSNSALRCKNCEDDEGQLLSNLL